ncbi:MAG: hypothetical protein IJ873_01215 [Lachnospiraceae bacterium]|nr:hypothetical protein [Lachnospiraceae bacterium]
MSARDQAVQLIQQIPDSELTFVIRFLRGMVLPERKPDLQAVGRLIGDLDNARDRAEREGWISEKEFFDYWGE